MKMIEISEEEYEELKHEIKVLRKLVAELTEEIARLKALLNKSSKNSNKPPSSDGFKKGAVKNSRVSSGKKSGGQKGHKGATKKQTTTPDEVIKLMPQSKCTCGGNILVETENFTVRQVTDIEPAKVVTVEYNAHSGVCDKCGKTHKATFPEDVKGTVSYGENLQALLIYLTVYQLLPLKRTTELLEDIFGIKISQGTIVKTTQEASKNLVEVERLIKEKISESAVVHFDESGLRVNKKTKWIHSAGTENYTLYAVNEKRGIEAMDEVGILPIFKGTAIHDHWKSYYHYDCAHGECNAHHLRGLKYIFEELNEAWAEEMASLLMRIKKHVDLNKLFAANSLQQEDIEMYTETYLKILKNAEVDIEKRPVESKRMIKRLKQFEQETLLFMIDFSVPFTNNLAERDIRMPKIKQKISGCFRSDDGAKNFYRVRGFTSTLKKQGKNILEGAKSIFKCGAAKFLFPNQSNN